MRATIIATLTRTDSFGIDVVISFRFVVSLFIIKTTKTHKWLFTASFTPKNVGVHLSKNKCQCVDYK
jgi:hypothetical protein